MSTPPPYTDSSPLSSASCVSTCLFLLCFLLYHRLTLYHSATVSSPLYITYSICSLPLTLHVYAFYTACLRFPPQSFLFNENIIMNFSSLFWLWVLLLSSSLLLLGFRKLHFAIFESSPLLFFMKTSQKEKHILFWQVSCFICWNSRARL